MIADPIRLAVVGLGAMGTRMLTAARSHPAYTVVAGVFAHVSRLGLRALRNGRNGSANRGVVLGREAVYVLCSHHFPFAARFGALKSAAEE